MTKQSESSRRRLILILLAGGLFGLWMVQVITFLVIPAQPERVDKIIAVSKGDNLRVVAQRLATEGLIKNSGYFILAGKLAGVERAIQPGEYAIHTRMRPLQIMDLFRMGKVLLYDVVVPEGYTVKQIADLLKAKELADADAIVELSRDEEFIGSLEIKSNGLEGYLFPSTYSLAKGTPPAEIIRMMVRAYREVFTPELQVRTEKLGLTEHEVVTLASIIEKETSSERERNLISAVFHNRLRLHMPLQSDPTVIYALSEFDGNLKRGHLKIDSPYNTYRWPGLPPGPIANPGKASLYAALYPAPVDYMFFVSRNDGTHYFSSNIREHNKAVAKYQKARPVRR